MKNLIILFALILSFSATEARSSKLEKRSNPMDRTWNYTDNSFATEGTFVNAKDGEVFITTGDEILTLQIHKLHWADRKYILSRVKKIESLSQIREQYTLATYKFNSVKASLSEHNTFWHSHAMIIFIATLSCFLMAWVFRNGVKRSIKYAFSMLVIINVLNIVTDFARDYHINSEALNTNMPANSDNDINSRLSYYYG